MCLVMDGFDVQSMGYVAPALIQEWGLSKEVLSPVFGAGLFGMLVGSLAFSTLADKIGRRPVLIGATLFFSVCMLLTAFANSIPQLVGFRFAAGLGLGCIMPNAMALAGEYSPRRSRVSIMMLVSCGFTLGGVVGGLISAVLIPAFGWRSVFFVGGAIPLLLGVIMWWRLPESIQFLAFKKGSQQQMRKNLLLVAPGLQLPDDAQLVLDEPAKTSGGSSGLAVQGRARARHHAVVGREFRQSAGHVFLVELAADRHARSRLIRRRTPCWPVPPCGSAGWPARWRWGASSTAWASPRY